MDRVELDLALVEALPDWQEDLHLERDVVAWLRGRVFRGGRFRRLQLRTSAWRLLGPFWRVVERAAASGDEEVVAWVRSRVLAEEWPSEVEMLFGPSTRSLAGLPVRSPEELLWDEIGGVREIWVEEAEVAAVPGGVEEADAVVVRGPWGPDELPAVVERLARVPGARLEVPFAERPEGGERLRGAVSRYLERLPE